MPADKLKENLIEFYGEECHFCNEMEPLVEKLEKELKIKVQKIETWHNEENNELREEFDSGNCGGVPYFYNRKTKKFICGAVSYEELKEWAKGK